MSFPGMSGKSRKNPGTGTVTEDRNDRMKVYEDLKKELNDIEKQQ